jgi:hypothetical protein
MKLSEAIKKILPIADAIRIYWDTELPKYYPNYPFANPGEEDPPPPPEEKKLKQLLARLSDHDIYKLALIVFLGKWGFDRFDLAGRYQMVMERNEDREWAVGGLLNDIDLADHLREGLEELNKKGLDVDHLTVAAGNSGSATE